MLEWWVHVVNYYVCIYDCVSISDALQFFCRGRLKSQAVLHNNRYWCWFRTQPNDGLSFRYKFQLGTTRYKVRETGLLKIAVDQLPRASTMNDAKYSSVDGEILLAKDSTMSMDENSQTLTASAMNEPPFGIF